MAKEMPTSSRKHDNRDDENTVRIQSTQTDEDSTALGKVFQMVASIWKNMAKTKGMIRALPNQTKKLAVESLENVENRSYLEWVTELVQIKN